eukprot:Nitzschia sp. Nitz4//NODE_491_length_15690_cov_71.798657//249//3356//NITZ4_additional_000071-RA//-1//CDS//3329531941//7411//frame0
MNPTTTTSATAKEKAEFIKVVVPPVGPVGLQLEENEEWGTRVVRFVDGGPSVPGFARASGQIQPGDWIVQVQLLLVEDDDSPVVVASANDYDSILSLLQHTSPPHLRELTVRSFATTCLPSLVTTNALDDNVVNPSSSCWIPLKSVSFESTSPSNDDRKGVFLLDFTSCSPQVLQANANAQMDPLPRHAIDIVVVQGNAEDEMVVSNREKGKECRDDLSWEPDNPATGISPSRSFEGQILLVSSTAVTNTTGGTIQWDMNTHPARMTLWDVMNQTQRQTHGVSLELEEMDPRILSSSRTDTVDESSNDMVLKLDSTDTPSMAGSAVSEDTRMKDLITPTNASFQQQPQQPPGGEDDLASIAYPWIPLLVQEQAVRGEGQDIFCQSLLLQSSSACNRNSSERVKSRSVPLFPPIGMHRKDNTANNGPSIPSIQVEHPWAVLQAVCNARDERVPSPEHPETKSQNHVNSIIATMENQINLQGMVEGAEEPNAVDAKDYLEDTTILLVKQDLKDDQKESERQLSAGAVEGHIMQKLQQLGDGIVDSPSQEESIQHPEEDIRRGVENTVGVTDEKGREAEGEDSSLLAAPVTESSVPKGISSYSGQSKDEEIPPDTSGGDDETSIAAATQQTEVVSSAGSKVAEQLEESPNRDVPTLPEDGVVASATQADNNTEMAVATKTGTSLELDNAEKSCQSDQWLHKAKAKHQLKLARLRVKKQLQKTSKVEEASIQSTEESPGGGSKVQNPRKGEVTTETTKGTDPWTIQHQVLTKQSLDKSIWFEVGPIGMQLEAHDRFAARVVRFVDGGPQAPGQARQSGQLQPGDFIVRVEAEGKEGTTYSTVLELFQCSWARRKVTCRSAWEEELALLSGESQQVAAMMAPAGAQTTNSNKEHAKSKPVPEQQDGQPTQKAHPKSLADDWIVHRQVVPDDILGQEIQLLSVYHPEAKELVDERMEAKFRARLADQVAHSEASRPADHLTRWNFEDAILETVAIAAEGVLGCFKNSHPGARLRRNDSDDDEDVYYEDDHAQGHYQHAKTD